MNFSFIKTIRLLFLGAGFPLLLLATPLSAKAKDQVTPVLSRILASPQAVLGSDGNYHLAYEILLTNASKAPWQLSAVNVLKQSGPSPVIQKFSGKQIPKIFSDLSERSPTDKLGPGQSGLLFLTLSFPDKSSIPREITHRFDFTHSGRLLSLGGPPTQVHLQDPILIGTPLKGKKWVAGDGCCQSHRHVRAALPINGQLFLAQRYAIDWEQLSDTDQIFTGDPKLVESYQCYGKEVIAIADAKVVKAIDLYADQVPGKLPDGIELDQADGNHVVLEIQPGVYALYAHLKKGSLLVRDGDRVQKGQVLAKIGNSGNTSEPHLHFHLMDSPSPLASNGLPYRLEQFDLLGKLPSTAAFDQGAAEGNPLKILQVSLPGPHRDQLPLDLVVVSFP